MNRWTILLLVVGNLPVLPLAAQVRKYTNEFLNIGAGAAGLGMGNSQVALVGDVTSGYWNPAGLALVNKSPQFALMHSEYFAGIGKYDYAGAAIPVQQGSGVLGFSLLRFAVDNIPNTLYLVGPDGSVNYNNVTTFSSADYALLLSYGRKIPFPGQGASGREFRVGVNIKVIHRIVGSFARSWGFGIDAGAQLDLHNWRFGLLARDITTTFNSWQFSFTNAEKQILYLTQNDIPVRSTEITLPKLIPGIAYVLSLNKRFALEAELDLDLAFDGRRNTLLSGNTLSVDPHMGLQLSYRDRIFLRAGISNIQRTLDDRDTTNQQTVLIYQPSIGAGFRVKSFHFEYAFTNLANQSQPLYSNIFSLQLDLNNLKRKGRNKK